MSGCNLFTDCRNSRAHASPLHKIRCRGVSAAAASAASIGGADLYDCARNFASPMLRPLYFPAKRSNPSGIRQQSFYNRQAPEHDLICRHIFHRYHINANHKLCLHFYQNFYPNKPAQFCLTDSLCFVPGQGRGKVPAAGA
jgi:hypothetical protein